VRARPSTISAISIPVETDPEPRQIGQEGGAARRIVPAAALVDDEHVAHLEPPKDRRIGTAGCDPLENQIGSRVGLVRETPAPDN
jgi:hypothetical protein